MVQVGEDTVNGVYVQRIRTPELDHTFIRLSRTLPANTFTTEAEVDVDEDGNIVGCSIIIWHRDRET